MHTNPIQVPEKGTYQGQLFNYWQDEFRSTHADYSAYIALNFAGVLDACRSKWDTLIQRHSQAGGERDRRAIERLQTRTMTGAAMAYESCFRQH